jgi:hypothetical protein
MCGCGRQRPEVITTVQAEQDEAARQALIEMEKQAVREAEIYAQSSANAMKNANS